MFIYFLEILIFVCIFTFISSAKISIKKGWKKQFARRTLSEIILFTYDTWCNTVMNEYGSPYVRPSRDNQIFSPSWVYYTFLSMEAPLKLRRYARILGSK